MKRIVNVMWIVAALAGAACNVETAPASAPAPKPAETASAPAANQPAPAANQPAPAANEPAEAARSERLVPTFADGKFIGFKVFAMKPESIYLKSGFQAGDLIVAIDGEAITKPEDLGKIDAALAKNGVAKLTVSRKGFQLPRPIELKK